MPALTGHSRMRQAGANQDGRALRKFREVRGLSGRVFSERTGISHGHVSALENGTRNLTTALKQRIGAGFNLTVEALSEELEALRLPDERYSSVIRDEPAIYHIRPTPTDDVFELADWLVRRMTPDEPATLIREFAEAAIRGDPRAAARARALLLLNQPPPK